MEYEGAGRCWQTARLPYDVGQNEVAVEMIDKNVQRRDERTNGSGAWGN